jgi:GxxExxY protein
MPVLCDLPSASIDQNRFHEIDRTVTGCAFAVHNSLGRFFDEQIYQAELSESCARSGLSTRLEVRITVSHKEFSKIYYVDFVAENSVPYELKAVEALAGSHHNQLLDYLRLLEWKHGKLLNFRPPSLESRFVSTTLNHAERMPLAVHDREWIETCPEDELLKSRLLDLLRDLGLFLEVSLYREALFKLMEKDSLGFKEVEIHSAGGVLGSHRMCLLDRETAWHLSAVRDHFETYGIHLTRLISHSNLRRLHWINLNHRQVNLKTFKK